MPKALKDTIIYNLELLDDSFDDLFEDECIALNISELMRKDIEGLGLRQSYFQI